MKLLLQLATTLLFMGTLVPATSSDFTRFETNFKHWNLSRTQDNYLLLIRSYEVLYLDTARPRWAAMARELASYYGVDIAKMYTEYLKPPTCPAPQTPPVPENPVSQPPSVQPQEPDAPAVPTEPTQPTQPSNPLPEQPTTPEQPPVPTDPTPIQPEQPEEPSTPLVPEEPTQPTPIEPEQPSEPTAPIEPGTPEQPTTPIEPTPEEPTQPTPPDNPEQPQEPTIPEQPQQPEEPIVPTEPVPPATVEASAQEEEFCIFDFIISLIPGIVIVPSEQKKTRGNPESFTLTCLRYGIIYHNIFCTSCQNRTGTAHCDRRLQRIVPFRLKQ